MTPFEANGSRWRVILLLAGALAFVALGVFVLTIKPTDIARTIAGVAAIAVFGAFFLIGLPRLRTHGAELRVDQRGIMWRRWSGDTIPWAAIDRITVGEIRGQHFACLFLRDPGAYRSTTFAGKLAGANKAMGFGDIALSVTGTDRSFDELMAAIERFAPTA